MKGARGSQTRMGNGARTSNKEGHKGSPPNIIQSQSSVSTPIHEQALTVFIYDKMLAFQTELSN